MAQQPTHRAAKAAIVPITRGIDCKLIARARTEPPRAVSFLINCNRFVSWELNFITQLYSLHKISFTDTEEPSQIIFNLCWSPTFVALYCSAGIYAFCLSLSLSLSPLHCLLRLALIDHRLNFSISQIDECTQTDIMYTRQETKVPCRKSA